MKNLYTYNAIPTATESRMIDGLDELENLRIIENGESYEVIHTEAKTIYSCKATSCTEAVRKYIDWLYGQMPVLEWSEEDEGYNETNQTDWASTGYRIEEDYSYDWEIIEER